jgi:hypothetical protein
MSVVFTLMFTLVPLFIAAVFVFVIGTFVVTAVKSVARWQDNNAQPVLTVPARVVTKRQHVSGGGHDSSASTWYHITFETVADGLRQEFPVGSTDYSGLAEGDTGDLTYQGTRYKGFIRMRRPVVPPSVPAPPPAPDWTCGYCHTVVRHSETKCPSCGATHQAVAIADQAP